ncbi:MAG: hypothetical protein KIT70_03240 [Anaerolineales bacterium]|nr:MAG: hypothetical protein KIT70_03240 [Anaerolineales bacterium]
MSKFLKDYGAVLVALVVAAAMIIASLMGYEDAWWIILTIYAVLSAVFTLVTRARKKSK